MKALVRCFALWLTLAVSAWLLLQPETSKLIGLAGGIGRMLLPTIAVVLTYGAVVALTQNRLLRLLFWIPTMAGWLTVSLLIAGRFDREARPDDASLLGVATLAAFLVAGWLAFRAKRPFHWRALGYPMAATSLLALATAVPYRLYEAKSASYAAQADARWTEIGLPMSEFEKKLEPTTESAGSKIVREAFREILGQRFYKEGTRAARKEPPIERSKEAALLVERACDIISAKLPPSDELDLSALPIAALKAHSGKLDEAYRSILAAEPAVWQCDPQDGPEISVPNFLGVRMFAQVASAEAIRRLGNGDEEGAKRALDACEKMGSQLERNPTLVALMIHVAVDALVSSKQARLSTAVDRFAALDRDVARWRDSFLHALQWESWQQLRRTDEMWNAFGNSDSVTDKRLNGLPQFARSLASHAYIRRQCVLAALNGAEHAALIRLPSTRTLPDCGASLHEAIYERHPNICDANVIRAQIRIDATLLLREQSELIRDSRARLAAGKVIESRDSVVLPGARWELNPDSERRTVSFRLMNAPRWVYESDVTGKDFWVLPLDGSIPWQFRDASLSTAAAR